MEESLTGVQKPAVNRVGMIVIAACLVILGAVIFWPKDAYDPNNANEVIAHCEAAVEKQLKAPTTAEFASTATGSGTWEVTGTVDSENSFGATVRSDYACTVTVENADRITTQVEYIR